MPPRFDASIPTRPRPKPLVVFPRPRSEPITHYVCDSFRGDSVTVNSAKKQSAVSITALAFSPTQKQKQVQSAINVDSDEDSDMKPKSTKPKLPKSMKSCPTYMKHESQNFLKHHCFYLEPGNAVMKLSCHLWNYDTSFQASNLSTKGGLQKINVSRWSI
eukprot:jgi/Psemu1/56308/gm1.56308_g